MTPRPAVDVLDQLIAENRAAARLCYALIVVFVAVGVGVIGWGCFKESAPLAAVGGIPTLLFWPALNAARAIRKENIAIRLMEIPLSTAKTSDAAAETLRKAFIDVFMKKQG